MARIVPAKPKLKTAHASQALAKLQGELSDDAILFQNMPDPEWMLMMAPGKLPVFVKPLPDVSSVDLDAQEITTTGGEVEIPDIMASVIEVASRLSLGDVGLVVLSGVHCSRRSLPRAKGVAEAVVTSDLTEVWQASGVQGSAITAEAINAILQVHSPGATAFVPGAITQTQLDWRTSLSAEQSIPSADAPDEAAVVSPAQVQTEKFRLNDGSPKRVQNLETMVGSILVSLAKGRQILAGGLPVKPEYVANGARLLPVLLIAASEKWSPVVAKAGTGGFDVRLSRDADALVGFRVADVLASSPYLLYMPLSRVARVTDTGANLDFDRLLGIFDRWLSKYDEGRLHHHSVTIRIATEQHLASQES